MNNTLKHIIHGLLSHKKQLGVKRGSTKCLGANNFAVKCILTAVIVAFMRFTLLRVK